MTNCSDKFPFGCYALCMFISRLVGLLLQLDMLVDMFRSHCQSILDMVIAGQLFEVTPTTDRPCNVLSLR